LAPDHLRPANKAMLRIYRDVRFAKDKTPYKTQLSAFWPRQGLEKTGGAGLFLQVGVHGVMVAGGAWSPGSEQLFALRSYLLEHYEEARALLAAAEKTGLTNPLDANPLVRPTKGFPLEHPAADLLRYRRWALTAHLPGDAALSEDFVDLVIERLQVVLPLTNFLNIPLATVTPLQREASTGRRR
jgi:uncharacterized protein (TIGR02453 family)